MISTQLIVAEGMANSEDVERVRKETLCTSLTLIFGLCALGYRGRGDGEWRGRGEGKGITIARSRLIKERLI